MFHFEQKLDDIGCITENINDILMQQIRKPIQQISDMNLIYLPEEPVLMKTLWEENINHRKVIGNYTLITH